MASMGTYTYYMTIEVEAQNEESAQNKLEGWLNPSLALKKNQSIEVTEIEVDGSEQATPNPEAEAPEEATAMPEVKKKARPALVVPKEEDWEKDFDELDWDTIGEEGTPRPTLATQPSVVAAAEAVDDDDWEDDWDDWDSEDEDEDSEDLDSFMDKLNEDD